MRKCLSCGAWTINKKYCNTCLEATQELLEKLDELIPYE